MASENALQVDELNSSSSSAESNENNIYVLTKDQGLQLELLNSISDPSLKQKFLEKIISSLNQKDVKTHIVLQNPMVQLHRNPLMISPPFSTNERKTLGEQQYKILGLNSKK